MSLTTVILVVLIILAFSGSFYDGGAYRGAGLSLGGVLLIVLLVLALGDGFR